MQAQIPFLPFFEQFITDSEKGKRRTAAGKRITAGTIQQYRVVAHYIRAFDQIQLHPLRIQPLYGHSKKQFLHERNYWKKTKTALEVFLQNKYHCMDMYIASVFKILKTFFNYLRTEKGIPVGAFHLALRLPCYLYQPVLIDTMQLQRLIQDVEFRKALPQHLCESLDMFVVGCITGLRFSDIIALKKTNLVQKGEQVFLQTTTKKTGTAMNIPLPHFILQLLERYKMKNGTTLFQKLSNNNFNLHLKKIMEKAGYTALSPKMRYRKGVLVEMKTKLGKTYRFCDHISAHTMRRTAITTLLVLGVPEMVVRKISGHAPGSKEFFRYVSLAQDYTNKHIEEAYAKLLK